MNERDESSTGSAGPNEGTKIKPDNGPDARPLGFIALLFAAPAVPLSLSYFLSAFAFLFAAVAIPLGLLARSDPRSRALGTIATITASAGVVFAILTLIDLNGQ